MEHIKTLIQYGNKKLPKTTAIFNMGSAMQCPSDSKGLCAVSDICYAKKAERMYTQVLPYRQRQRDKWLRTDAFDLVIEFLEAFVKKRTKPTHLRLNESGDFYSQACVIKAEYIAQCLSHTGVRVYIYTARKDLDFSKCKYLVVNGSGFRKEGVNRSFTAVDDTTQGNDFVCLNDCTICDKCSINDNVNIIVGKH